MHPLHRKRKVCLLYTGEATLSGVPGNSEISSVGIEARSFFALFLSGDSSCLLTVKLLWIIKHFNPEKVCTRKLTSTSECWIS